jgi:hypothetical protein
MARRQACTVLTGFPSLRFQFQCELLPTATLTFTNSDVWVCKVVPSLDSPTFPTSISGFIRLCFPAKPLFAPLNAIESVAKHARHVWICKVSHGCRHGFASLGFPRFRKLGETMNPSLEKPCSCPLQTQKSPRSGGPRVHPQIEVVPGQPSGRILIGHPQCSTSATA